MPTTEDFIREDIAKACDAERVALIRSLLSPTDAEHTAMLLAASKIPLERENGGLEYPPFKVFNAMLRAYAASHHIAI